MSFYLDASVLLPLIVEEASSEADSQLIASSDLVVGTFAVAETASAVSRLVRMGKLSPAEARERLTDIDVWRATAAVTLEVEAADVRFADDLVRRFELKLRAPDALHLAICRRRAQTLVTLDRRLATAAHALGVAVAMP